MKIYQNNDVNGTKTNGEGVASGRCLMDLQRGPDRHIDTVRKKWNKQVNIAAMECFYLSKPVDENGVPIRGYRQRLHRIWMDRGLFETSEQRICDQVRAIRKNGWLTELELEAIQRRVSQEEVNENEDQQTDEDTHVEINRTEEEGGRSEIEVEDDEQEILTENTDLLSGEEQEILKKIAELMKNKEFEEVKGFNKVDCHRLRDITNRLNRIMKHVKMKDISEINNLIRATSVYAAKELGLTEWKKRQNSDPWWKRRIEGDIKGLRRDVNILVRKNMDQLKYTRKYSDLCKKYNINRKGLLTVIEELKQRIKAKAAKIQRNEQRINQHRQNRTFSVDQKRLYQELNSNIRQEGVIPDAEEGKEFWGSIWGDDKTHNVDAEWLETLKRKNKCNVQDDIIITTEMISTQCRKVQNWKAPGPDGVQRYWLKKLTSLHERIAVEVDNIVNGAKMFPHWMTLGRTVLCLKDPAKGNAVDNFQPISCLPVMWKLMTEIIAESMYVFLENENVLPEEQKGCRRKSRGTKYQLLIEKTILKDCKRRHTNLATAWIDYRNAYDMVPHTWIMECMRLFRVANNITEFIKCSMGS